MPLPALVRRSPTAVAVLTATVDAGGVLVGVEAGNPPRHRRRRRWRHPLIGSAVAAPVPVPATDGRTHLAYELQLTNALAQERRR